MKPFTLLALIGLILSACLAPVQPQGIAGGVQRGVQVVQGGVQIPCTGVQLGNQLTIECDQTTPTPPATRVIPEDLPTATEVPAEVTEVPLPTSTPTITPVPLPTVTPTALARVDYPLCAEHDVTKWHALEDPIRHCHYDHFHGDDPESGQAVAVFGSYPLSQTISYPFMTHTVDMAIVENRDKHTGYIMLTRFGLPYHPELNWIGFAPMAVTDLRFQGHFMTRVNGGLQDDITRVHSFFIEVKICTTLNKVITADCGIIRGGGHWDTGILHVPYKEFHVPLSVDPPTPLLGFNLNEDPYRAHLKTVSRIFGNLAALPDAFSPGAVFNFDDTNRDNPVLWTYAPGKYGFQRHGLGAMVMVFDHPNALDATDPVHPIPICKEACRFNGSEWAIFTVGAKVPTWMDGTLQDLDGLKNGRLTFHGYTDTFGNISTSCKAPGEFCVPYSIEDVPVVGNGWAAYDTIKDNGKERISEFDTSPKGTWWVK